MPSLFEDSFVDMPLTIPGNSLTSSADSRLSFELAYSTNVFYSFIVFECTNFEFCSGKVAIFGIVRLGFFPFLPELFLES